MSSVFGNGVVGGTAASDFFLFLFIFYFNLFTYYILYI